MNKWYLFLCGLYFYLGLSAWSLRAAQQQHVEVPADLDVALVGLTSQSHACEWGLYLYKPGANGQDRSALGRVRFSVNRDKEGDLVGAIERLEVAKNYRKKGYGSALFVMGCDFLRSLKVVSIDVGLLPELGYEKKLEDFYKRLGCIVDRSYVRMHLDLGRCKPLLLPDKELVTLLERYKKYEQSLRVNLGAFDARASSPEELLLHIYVLDSVRQHLAARFHDKDQDHAHTETIRVVPAQSCKLTGSVVGLLLVTFGAAILTCYQLFHPLLFR